MTRCARCKKLLEDCGCDGLQGVLKQSLFSKALAGLLDDTNWFSRKEWSAFLGVSTQVIDAWEKDEIFPRAEYVRILLDLLHNSADIPQEPLTAFEVLLAKPLEEITPLAKSFPQKTLNDYLDRKWTP